MKSSKFQFDLINDLIITEDNVQAIGERVALGSVRFLMRYSGTMLNRLYWELCEEVFSFYEEETYMDVIMRNRGTVERHNQLLILAV